MRAKKRNAMEKDAADILPDPEFLLKLSKTRMPFGFWIPWACEPQSQNGFRSLHCFYEDCLEEERTGTA
jgi:hypothetical protein